MRRSLASMTQLAIRLAHHDHEYVEARGGWALLTHLRAVASRRRYRSRAIDRSLPLLRLSSSLDLRSRCSSTVGPAGCPVVAARRGG